MSLGDYLRWLVDAGLGTHPGHRRRDPRRRRAQHHRAAQARSDALGRDREDGPRAGAALQLDDDVRPHREPGHVAAHLALLRELQKQTGGFTEFVPLGFIHEKNVLFNHLGARAGADARGPAADRRGAPLPAALDHEHPGLVGEDGPEARAGGADVRRERLRRHADGRVDQPRVGLRARREPARRGDAPADPRDRPHARGAQHHLRDPAPLRRPGADPPSLEPSRARALGPARWAGAPGAAGARDLRCGAALASARRGGRGSSTGSGAARARGCALDLDGVAHGRVVAV